MAFTKYQNGLG